MPSSELTEKLHELADRGATGLKMEFEAEGTRHYEYLRFIDLAKSFGMSITAKIGGCEAVSDIHTLRAGGATKIVAPMIESSYATAKFHGIIAASIEIPSSTNTSFGLMIETKDGFEKRLEILDLVATEALIQDLAFGRVDFAGSIGKDRSDIESPIVRSAALELAMEAKSRSLSFTVGGAISPISYENLLGIREVHLTSFETRKVVFDSSMLDSSSIDFEQAVKASILFEAAWLETLSSYENRLSDRYRDRAKFLRQRALGG